MDTILKSKLQCRFNYILNTVYLEILVVKTFGDFTLNPAFKNIGVILIWRQIHESLMHATSTIANKMLSYFYFGYSNINRQIAKFN